MIVAEFSGCTANWCCLLRKPDAESVRTQLKMRFFGAAERIVVCEAPGSVKTEHKLRDYVFEGDVVLLGGVRRKRNSRQIQQKKAVRPSLLASQQRNKQRLFA